MKSKNLLNMKRKMNSAILLVFLMVLVSWQCTLYGQPTKEAKGKPVLDVPYEPTSYGIAAEMLNMANVTSADIVYDLGCGDGRIVIMAAKERKARGIGVDLDPQRIRESKENARSAGVGDLVQFFEQNLFETDISNATVVMLYLWPEVNIQVRPKLLRELKPGTRIVSHSHTMGDWRPDAKKKVEGHDLYYFVVPANVTGTWKLTGPNKNPAFFRFNQDFQVFNGSMSTGTETYPVTHGHARGNNIRFTVEKVNSQGSRSTLLFEGNISGNSMEGKMKNHLGYTISSWKAVRDPATATAIAR